MHIVKLATLAIRHAFGTANAQSPPQQFVDDKKPSIPPEILQRSLIAEYRRKVPVIKPESKWGIIIHLAAILVSGALGIATIILLFWWTKEGL
jgi:hypothetical protein